MDIRVLRLTSRQGNLTLAVLIVLSVFTGVLSWIVPLSWARPVTVVHAVSAFSMLVVTPLKLRGSVRAGFRRGRTTRWVSAVFGVLVVGTIAVGMVHSTGLWYGVGYWSALWTHLLLRFATIPFIVWHIWSRPVRPGKPDFTRRGLVSGAAATAVAGGVVLMQELAVRAVGLDGADRGGTGSHDRASFDPANMPVVSWIDDRTPRTPLDEWVVTVDGQPIDLDALATTGDPLEAVLDCTGGWRSTQRWDVVSLDSVVTNAGDYRSIRVASATGYSRLFSRSAASGVFLATGYNGESLSRGHGAPLRIVAPGRRGPWWVKWITTIETTDRPAWLQLPFPPT